MVSRFVQLHAKLLGAVIAGIAVAVLSPWEMRGTARFLIGWDAGIAVYFILMQTLVFPVTIERIRKRAAEEDEGAFAILVLALGASIASMIAIVAELGVIKEAHGGSAALHVLLAISTIVLSWFFVHTAFSIHYAHEYYGEKRDGIIGGLNFPEDKEPDYRDFMYFSLVIGMTSQVSDVAITSKAIRRMAALHGVFSFFFNFTVLALSVNMVSNLI
jgi:uncharacterized membrane protein